MLSKEEFDKVIYGFLVELNHICLDSSQTELEQHPRFNSEIPGYLAELRNPENNAAQALYQSFAFVDEFIGADKARILDLAYSAYLKSQSKRA